jgi:hypothetical protein
MRALSDHAGSWTGTNEFRLMPTDPPHEAAATAEVSPAAAGQLTSIAYTWTHPEDGEQDGLLVVGPDDESEGVVALWGDSWHQSPAPKVLTGSVGDRGIQLSYLYGGNWRWEITVDPTDPDALYLRMDNVVPESADPGGFAGAYPAMETRLRRANDPHPALTRRVPGIG